MRAVVQRVSKASVSVAGEVVSAIGQGFLVLLGVECGDGEADAQCIAQKLIGLRVFDDEAGKMNLDIQQAGGEMLIVSQFTLLGDARKGRRPGFTQAAAPDVADGLYRRCLEMVREAGIAVGEGRFQTHMQVSLVNDGPVTLLLDSRKLF